MHTDRLADGLADTQNTDIRTDSEEVSSCVVALCWFVVSEVSINASSHNLDAAVWSSVAWYSGFVFRVSPLRVDGKLTCAHARTWRTPASTV